MDVERELVEATIQDLLQVRNNLLAQRAELDDRLSKLTGRIEQWRSQLIPAENGSVAAFPKIRRKKGENLEVVERAFLDNPSERGMTIREVSDASGLPWSSTRNVLQKHADRYEEREGRWHRKAETRERLRLDNEQ